MQTIVKTIPQNIIDKESVHPFYTISNSFSRISFKKIRKTRIEIRVIQTLKETHMKNS
jgi:hypothetical protein